MYHCSGTLTLLRTHRPRGEFMMIALPNQDKSWTCTIFMPSRQFEAIKTDEQVLTFMKQYFPDAIPLMPTLLQDWQANPASKLVMVCLSVKHVI